MTRRRVVLASVTRWAQELGQSEAWVRQHHRVNLWSRPGPGDRGRVVGQIRPGSKAFVLAETADAYRVVSPLDGSIGWIGKLQVKRTQ